MIRLQVWVFLLLFLVGLGCGVVGFFLCVLKFFIDVEGEKESRKKNGLGT